MTLKERSESNNCGEKSIRIRYGQYENDGRKSGAMKIIRYGPYIKSGNNKIRKLGFASQRQSKSSVCEIIMLATITIVLLHAVE